MTAVLRIMRFSDQVERKTTLEGPRNLIGFTADEYVKLEEDDIAFASIQGKDEDEFVLVDKIGATPYIKAYIESLE